MGAINSDILGKMLVDDLMEYNGYTEPEAREWLKEHADSIVSDMWDAYSDYKDKNVESKEEEEE